MFITTLAVLRPTPGKDFESIAVVGDMAAEIVDQPLRKADDVLGLGAIKSDRLHVVAKFILAESKHLFWGIGDLEERARRLVDASVCGLRGKHHGDQERKWVGVLQFALRVGVCGVKAPENLANFGFGEQRRFAVLRCGNCCRLSELAF